MTCTVKCSKNKMSNNEKLGLFDLTTKKLSK